MIDVRRSTERSVAALSWRVSKHTFSFGEYYDPKHMGVGPLRVINEDKIIPGAGFDTHGHQNMEILSYVLDGALEHKDSLGGGSVIHSGDIQRMTAGTGILHSEYNPSQSEPVHFLQIWIRPDRDFLQPSYEQNTFPQAEKRGRLRLVGSRDGREGSIVIHQDVRFYAGLFTGGERAGLSIGAGRVAWVQMARGAATVNGVELAQGDGAALGDIDGLTFEKGQDAEILVFDMAA